MAGGIPHNAWRVGPCESRSDLCRVGWGGLEALVQDQKLVPRRALSSTKWTSNSGGGFMSWVVFLRWCSTTHVAAHMYTAAILSGKKEEVAYYVCT